jgi:hypothetical protein
MALRRACLVQQVADYRPCAPRGGSGGRAPACRLFGTCARSSTPVHLLLAGNQTSDYAQRARALDWEKLCADDLGEHVEHLREGWRKDYDFVLIDSRTGLADTAGICTVQMPGVLTLVFTASRQSLSGVAHVAKRVLQVRSEAAGSRGLPYCLPIMSRLAEIEEVDLAKKGIGVVSEKNRRPRRQLAPAGYLRPALG